MPPTALRSATNARPARSGRPQRIIVGRPLLLAIMTLAAACVTACSFSAGPIRITATPAATAPPAPTADPLIMAAARLAPDAIGPLTYPAGVNPLTGLPVDNPEALNRRPLAVKISNAPDSVRPQAGIGLADLVFEHIVEGGLTRFTAIFWTHTPPRIGSIRSARLIDLQIPEMYGALFTYSGANAIIQQRITEQPFAARAFEGVRTGPPLYFRDEGIEMPHNLFIVPAEVWARARESGLNDPPDRPGMLFENAPPASDEPANRITIDYGPDWIEWRYDTNRGIYWRWVDGDGHYDALTDRQVSAANGVVLYVPHEDDPDIVAGQWNGEEYYRTDIALNGSGPAVICRDGQRIEGVWRRLREDGVLTLWTAAEDGALIALKPGNTWFEIVPVDFSHAWAE